MHAFSSAPPQSGPMGRDLLYMVMVLILSLGLGGVFPAIVVWFSRNAVWGTWLVFWFVLLVLSRQVYLPRLLAPVVPLVLWVLAYIILGWMAATYPILQEGIRLAFRFGSVVAAVAIVTSHPLRLKRFAEATQWVLVVNLVLTLVLMHYPQYQVFEDWNVNFGAERFSGLWGNANQAGLVSLLCMTFSHWSRRWMAWLGRASGCLIIYLTESRTAFVISATLLLVQYLFVMRPLNRLRIALVVAVLAIGAGVFMRDQTTAALEALGENPTVMRVLDLTESRTRAKGGESRVDVFDEWLKLAKKAPWYGYGLYTMAGAESADFGGRKGFPMAGTHNLYLGIWIDIGPIGLLAFLAVVGWQLVRIWKAPIERSERRIIYTICFITLVFSLANHNMLSDYPGWTAFSLIFLLPTSAALRRPCPRTPADPADPERRLERGRRFSNLRPFSDPPVAGSQRERILCAE